MSSLRGAIEQARQKGVQFGAAQGSVRELARAVGLPAPHSVRTLIRMVDSLPSARPSDPGDEPAPQIGVRSEGVGSAAVFIVTGTGFLPNRTVTVRVVDDQLATLNFQQSADAGGKLVMRQSIPCLSGRRLHFSATDSRRDPDDLTGVKWSDTVHMSCP